MKRFYKEVGVQRAGANFAVTLDGRTIKTPSGAVMVLRAPGLADAVAAEWTRVGTEIDLDAMHLTRLAYAAVDSDRADIAAKLAKFARTDLVFYRAEEPPALVERQERAWDIPLAWVRARYEAAFRTGTGVTFIEQPAESLAAIEHALLSLDMYKLVALNAAAGILGSVVLALNLADAKLDAKSAFTAAHIDETFQAEKWGWDAAAQKRLDRLSAELASVETFLQLS
ncbi:MAG TPA: ATP12 family protein [Rhizomicrobium sp.]|jgi:chaperone required for assembly of F1-ATPase